MTEALTTHAPNRMPLTSFFGNDILEVSKNNTQAQFLALTATNFTVDATVTAGHVHDTEDTRIYWKQLFSYPLVNNAGGILASPNEAWDALVIDQTSFTVIAFFRLWVSTIDATQIIPRFKVSNDNSAVTTCRITLDFYEMDGTTLVLSQPANFSTITARNHVWIDNAAIDVSAATPDPTWSQRLPLMCRVTAKVDALTEFVALHEIAIGVTP